MVDDLMMFHTIITLNWLHIDFTNTSHLWQMFISQRCNKNPFCSPHRIIEKGCCLGSAASPLGRFLLPPLVEDLSDLDSQKLLLSDTLSIPVTEIDTKKKREKIVASSPDVVYFGGEDVRSEKTMGFRCRNGDLNNVLIESLLWRKLVFFSIFFQDMFSSIRREWRSKICHTGAFQKIYCKPLQMGPFLTSFQSPN